jgi:hypothetical protein
LTITQHVPNFVDGVEPKHAEFNCVEELLVIPWVDSWKQDSDKLRPFHRFSVERNYRGESTLMIERNCGRWWWVIGFIRGGDVDLPEWKPVP